MTEHLARFVEAHSRAMAAVVLSFALAGILFLFQIPVAIFPQTDFPRIVVRVENGIAPVDVQMVTVTRRLEEALRLVPGITDIRSVTSRGSTDINVFFRWETNILDALHLVQGRITEAMPSLPANTRVSTTRVTFSVFPMIGFSITSETRSLTDLYDLAYYQIAPRLYRLPGIAETRIVGGRPREFHIVVDPARLNSYGLSLNKVVASLRDSNVIQAAGYVQENYHLYLTTVTGLLRQAEQIENAVIDVVKGTPVQIKDVASVVPGAEPVYNIVTADGKPAVLVNVLQQPDGNAVQIADAVNRELADIRKTLPPDTHLSTFYDQSILVRDSIHSVRDSIVIGLFLSVLVLLLFLKNWRITVIAALVIPIATLIAVVFMKLFGMSFNLMTLGGIAACIGVVIDDAIVMVENIVVHLSLGQTPQVAARSAIRELTPALVGSTLTPIVVFVPLVFLGGITAVFFRALALTLVTALLASLFLAIFFTPVLAGFFLRHVSVRQQADLEAAERAGEGKILRWVSAKYEQSLRWCLGHTPVVLASVVGILACSVLLYNRLGSTFLPEMDEGAFVLDYITPAGTSLAETDHMLLKIENLLRQTPEVESYSRRTGAQLGLDIAEPNTGDFLVKLRKDRHRAQEEIQADLRQSITRAEPAVDIEFASILNDLVGDLVSSPEPVEIKIFHPNEKLAQEAAVSIAEWLPKVHGVVDVVNRTVVIGPAANFRVNPVKAQRAGFSVSDIASIESAILDGQVALPNDS